MIVGRFCRSGKLWKPLDFLAKDSENGDELCSVVMFAFIANCAIGMWFAHAVSLSFDSSLLSLPWERACRLIHLA